jgi:hypothetical protein
VEEILTGIDRMDRMKKMLNDECGMMNDERHAVFHSALIVQHSSFLPYPVHPVYPC